MNGASVDCDFVIKMGPNCALRFTSFVHQYRLCVDVFNDVTFSITMLCHEVTFFLFNDAVPSSYCVRLSDVTT